MCTTTKKLQIFNRTLLTFVVCNLSSCWYLCAIYSFPIRLILSPHPINSMFYVSTILHIHTHIFYMNVLFVSFWWPRKGQWNFHLTYNFFCVSSLTTIQMQQYSVFPSEFLLLLYYVLLSFYTLLFSSRLGATGRNKINDYFT